MIKRIVDALRGVDGYAGMAAYSNGCMLFSEGMEPVYVGRIKELFDEAGARFPAGRMTLVIRGYTITVFMAGDILVFCRSEGWFTPLPVLSGEEPEYTAGQAPPGLITKEEARKEAAAMLKALMSSG